MSTNKYWITAQEFTKRTGMTKDDLRKLRRDNPDLYKTSKGGGYLYNISAIPETLLKAS